MTYTHAYDRETEALLEDGRVLLLMAGHYMVDHTEINTTANDNYLTLLPDTSTVSTKTILTFLTEKQLSLSDGFSWLSDTDAVTFADWVPPADESRNRVVRQTIHDKPYLCYSFGVYVASPFSSSSLGSDTGKTYYLLRDISSLEERHETLTFLTVLVSFVASVLFAVVSWFVMKKHVTVVYPVGEELPSPDESVYTPPSSRHPSRRAPSQDLGALCRALVDRLASEAEENGLTISGSAMPQCLVSCDAKGLALLVERLLRLGFRTPSEEGRLSLLVRKQAETVILTVHTAGIALAENALADCRQLALSLDGVLTAEGGTVTVTWEPQT